MKRFEQFMQGLNEADIRKNPAVSPEYLADLNRRAEENAQAVERRFGRDMGALMRAVHEVQSIQRGKEKELEDLTTRVIMNQYGSILGDVELDIRIPTGPREMKAQMKAHEEESDLEMPTIKDLENEDTQTAIHKRKILNMIAQGEAINSKLMLMSEENMAGLTELFGDQRAQRMVEKLVEITEICNARDWRIPEEVAARMIEQGDALSGVSRIEWTPKKDSEEQGEEGQEEMGSEEEMEGSSPRIIILGMDQAMLFHEAVKGIYGLINQGGLSHLDDKAVQTVFMNADTPGDEAQDLKRAKLTAADLRDFLNQFPEITAMENGREYVWGKMIDASVLPDTEFLQLMKNIFDASPVFREGSEPSEKAREAMMRAKAAIQKIIRMIQDELDEYEQAMRDWEMGQEEGPEEFEGPEADDLYTQLGLKKPGDLDIDLSKPEPSSELERLQDELDQAIDDEDYELAVKLRDQIEAMKRSS
jgi:hypothetical protein